MSVVILILKIIGIILLAVLGLVLLAVFSLLLVPVRYRIIGAMQESIDVKLRISWLLHIVSFSINYRDKEMSQKLRVFGIPVKVGGKDPEDAALFDSKEPDRFEPSNIRDSEEKDRESAADISDDSDGEERFDDAFDAEVFFDDKPKSKKRPGFIGMIRNKTEKLKAGIRSFKTKCVHIWELLKPEENKMAIAAFFREIKYFLRHIAPHNIRADASFSTGDPATTGQALGAISTLPFVYRYRIHLLPDFEAERFYIQGNFDLKGHARGVHALFMAFRLLKDKHIRSLIKRYRNS